MRIDLVICIATSTVLVGIIVWIQLSFWREDWKKIFWPVYASPREKAGCFCRDLVDKLYYLDREDRFTYTDYFELLPICINADEWYDATHPEEKVLPGKGTKGLLENMRSRIE
jgi:hypothetical protein